MADLTAKLTTIFGFISEIIGNIIDFFSKLVEDVKGDETTGE